MNKVIIILLLVLVTLSGSQCGNNATTAPTNNTVNNSNSTNPAAPNSAASTAATPASPDADHPDDDAHSDQDQAETAETDDLQAYKPTAEAMAAAEANIEKLRRQYATPQVGKLIKLPSGLQYVDLKAGFGLMPQLDKYIAVHYTGKLENGQVFETTRNREPFLFRFKPGRVIKGWEEGLATLKVGGVRKLIVPPQLAYGEKGTKIIPPKATLIFEVELLEAETDEEEE
jgi:peptidylprolyl isomerase